MTAPDLLRQLADCMEAKDRLEDEVARLTRELAAAKAARATDDQEWFTNVEAALFIGRSKDFLNQDRCKDRPVIPFYKDDRAVRYKRPDLVAFRESRRCTSNRRG